MIPIPPPTQPAAQTLGFEERFGLLVEREWTLRGDRRLDCRLKAAKLRRSSTLATSQFPISTPPLTAHLAALGVAWALAVPLLFFLAARIEKKAYPA